MILIAILVGALCGGILFVVAPGMLPGAANIAGLVGLMISPIGVIVGAVVGAAYWLEHSAKTDKGFGNKNQINE